MKGKFMAAPKSYRRFYDDKGVDKGASKPIFCYPERKKRFEEETTSMRKLLESGNINAEHKMSYELRIKEREKRLESMNSAEENARKVFDEDKDYWVDRRKKLAEEITGTMPSRDDIRKRRVNPHKIIRQEKSGFEDKKKEYIVISRLMGEDSNVSFLQRDS